MKFALYFIFPTSPYTYMKGLYIHVPFCRSRCIYCDFFSTTQGEEAKGRYVQSLCQELYSRRCYAGSPILSSIYMGGGTPSILSPQQLHTIFSTIKANYEIEDGAEITIEANPDDINPEFISTLKQLGINRISLGIQTFKDSILKVLNRRHNGLQAIEAVHLLHENGIENISIDLIYGLPQQTLSNWESDLQTMLQLPITHLSAYALIYEEGTPIERMRKEGQVKEANEELSLAMYELLIQKSAEQGLLQYEISNFAKPGMQAKHNSSYWANKPYLGCGPGAHSYDGQKRRFNLPNLQKYCNGEHLYSEELLSQEERFNERIMTALRTRKGLSLNELGNEFGLPFQKVLLKNAQDYLSKGQLVIENDYLRLSQQGIFISDLIISELMIV